jgi:hypothetical protein
MYHALQADALLDDFLFQPLPGSVVSENLSQLEEIPHEKAGDEVSEWVRTILRREVGLEKRTTSTRR